MYVERDRINVDWEENYGWGSGLGGWPGSNDVQAAVAAAAEVPRANHSTSNSGTGTGDSNDTSQHSLRK